MCIIHLLVDMNNVYYFLLGGADNVLKYGKYMFCGVSSEPAHLVHVISRSHESLLQLICFHLLKCYFFHCLTTAVLVQV